MDPNDFALVRLGDTGKGGMLNVTMTDRNDSTRRVVIVYDHDSGEFFDRYLHSKGRAIQLGDLDTSKLLAGALSCLASSVML